jgi:hypothetical protein
VNSAAVGREDCVKKMIVCVASCPVVSLLSDIWKIRLQQNSDSAPHPKKKMEKKMKKEF